MQEPSANSPPPAPANLPEPRFRPALLLGLALLTFFGLRAWSNRDAQAPLVSYSQFYAAADAGKVREVSLRGQAVTGKLKQPTALGGKTLTVFRSFVPAQTDDKLVPLLRDKGVDINVESEEQPLAVQIVLSLLPWVLIMGVWAWLGRRAQRALGAGGPFAGMLKGRSRRFEKEAQVSVRFDDVAGLRAAKQDLQEIVDFLKQPDMFRKLGGKVPRGLLLVGPPGTGKTLLARAVAGEAGVPFFSINGSEFIELFVGVGAARVRELFDQARKVAPAIVFIDEIDAVGRARGAGLGGGHDEREQTLNQLLSEMDGFSRNDLTIVMAATNRPDVLDPALLRPGRFDRRVLVDRPELAARRAILDVHTRDKPLSADVDLDAVAGNTPGFSGADLANLVNEAALNATRRFAEAIAGIDFTHAYDKIVLGDPRETKLDVDEKQRVAVHEAGHAVVAHFSPFSQPLHRVTIIPRGMSLGVTQQTPTTDRHIMAQAELESRLRVLLGGYAAERIVLGDISSGAENDLKKASELAFKMVAHFGMSERVGPVFHEHRSEHPFLGQTLATDGGTSDATVHVIEQETRELLLAAVASATRLIEQHRTDLQRLVGALIEHESVEKDQLLRLLGPPLTSSHAAPIEEPLHARRARL